MAIQEFIIGPQNYFEAGYFDGDYTLPNVSKAFLECDIDKIRGGRVITGEYFLDNYIDGTYYHNNSMSFNMVVDATIVQEATAGLQGYYTEGYFGSGYYQQRGSFFVLSAELSRVGQTVEASGSWTSAFTQTAQAGKKLEISASISAAFTQTTAITNFRGITLSAFGQAAIAIEVSRIRDNNAQVSSVFSVATDGRRFRDLASAEDAAFTFSVVNQRSRAFIFETQAAFSLTGVNSRTRRTTVSLTSTVTLACTISHIEGADIIVNGFAALSAIPDNRTRDMSVSLSSSSSLTVLNRRVRFSSSSMAFFGFFTAENRRIRLISKTLTAVTALTAVSEKYKTFGNTTLSSAFALSATGIRAPRDNEYPKIQTRALLHMDSEPIVDEYTSTVVNGLGGTVYEGRFGNSIGQPITAIPSITNSNGLFTNLVYQSAWTIDFWFKAPILTYNFVTPSVAIFAIKAVNDSEDYNWTIAYSQTTLPSNGSSGSVNGRFASGGAVGPLTTYTFNTVTDGSVANEWRHVAVTYEYLGERPAQGSGYYEYRTRVWVDGVAGSSSSQIISIDNTSNSLFLFPTLTNVPDRDGQGSFTRSFRGRVDEIRFQQGIAYTGNFTPPTQAYNPYLYYRQGAGRLDTVASLSATGLNVQFGTVTAASSATASIIPNRIRPGLADITARFIQLTVPTRTASNVTANFVITATQTATAQRARLTSASVSAATALSIDNKRTRFASSAMSAQSSMTIEARVVGSARTDLSVTFAQSTVNGRIRFATPQLDAIATNLTAAFRNATGTVLLESVTAMTVIAQKITVQPITLSSEFTQSTDTKRFRDLSSAMSAEVTQTTVGERIQPAGADITASFAATINTANSKTTRVSAQMQTTVTAVTVNDRGRSTSLAVSSAFTAVANNQVLRLASATLSSVSESVFVITKVVRITAVLQCQGFQVVVGDVFNIDPALQLKIEPETRINKIPQETRVLSIESETRVNIIED